MSQQLTKKICDQVIVITGASSGIGLATAIMAAEQGARVVLAAQNKCDLRDAVSRIRQSGGEAIYVEADVAKLEDVDRVAKRAVEEFGRIDSWINNAGTLIFGKLTEVPMEEKRRFFEVNFWGVVYGCRAAVKLMQKSGGAIINVGSTVSDPAIPIQGMYSVTKQAVKAYSDVLRRELEADKILISISLVKPASINIDAKVVATAILNCCEQPQRDVYAGGSAKFYSLMEKFVPRFTDFLMERILMDQADPKLVRNPAKSAAVAAGLGVAAFAAYKALQNARKPGEVIH